MKTLRQLICTSLVLIAASQAGANHPATAQGPGFIILAEHRFDPAIQRFLADRALKSLPLGGGQLYFVYPRNIDPQLEEIQIRYLEQLIDKQKKVEPKEQ